MMFLFAIPIFEAIAVLFLPQMLGARDLPFPRLSAFGFWCFLLGGVFLCGSIFFDAAPHGGWFMYPPLTSKYQPDIGADIWLLGFSFIEIAAIAAAVEMIVGSLKTRPPGMRLNLMPLYVWYVLVAAVMIVFAFPPLIAGSMLLEIERAFDWPFFNPERGGDPLLWQHLFWLFGHPEVYIIFLPSVALIAMIVPTFAQRPIVGYSWIVLAAVGTGFLSFGLWVHHMFTTGLPGITLGLFAAASQAVALPTGVQIFCFIATLAAGRVVPSVPMLWAFGSLVIFVLGGLTGVMVAVAPFDFQAHDTFFVVAHMHYVLIGGALFPIFAGCYYFFPLISGKLLSDKLAKIAFWLAFVGFNIAFLPMHVTGLRGMPRRVFTYPAGMGFDGLNLVSTIGAFILAAGIAVVFWDIFRPKRNQPYAERNPWRAGTIEWTQEMPGQPWGIRSIPEIDSRYPLWDQPNFVRDIDEGRFYLPDAEEGRRETIITSVLDAEPQQCARLPGSSFITLWAALGTGGFFIFGTYHWWTAALISLIAGMAVIIFWLWTGTGEIPEKESKDVGLGLTLPLYLSGRDVGRLVGDVHHHAGAIHGIYLFGLRLFLLLDGARRLSTRTEPGARGFLAGRRISGDARFLGLNAFERALESPRQRDGFLPGPRVRDFFKRRRRSGAARGSVAHRPRSSEPCLWRNRMDPGDLGRSAGAARHHHATLLHSAPPRRAHDRALRHGHSQRRAVLAFHRVDCGDHGGGDRRISATLMMNTFKPFKTLNRFAMFKPFSEKIADRQAKG